MINLAIARYIAKAYTKWKGLVYKWFATSQLQPGSDTIAVASISTSNSGEIRAETSISVQAGRMFLKHSPCAGAQWFPDSDGNAHEGDACEHFCHAHVVGLTAQVSSAAPPHFQNYAAAPPARIVTHSVAPPTPPPNL